MNNEMKVLNYAWGVLVRVKEEFGQDEYDRVMEQLVKDRLDSIEGFKETLYKVMKEKYIYLELVG